MWTDRSGTFKVEAEFLGLKDGKIHLHKTNGVKIAVPVGKMSSEDMDYVEHATGQTLDDDRPLSDFKRNNAQQPRDQSLPGSSSRAGASVQQVQGSKYDWFDFFLQCGVHPQICDRYASAFDRDQMGEESLQDIDPPLLRTLGIKEGDIIRVMKLLDSKYGRTRDRAVSESAGADTNGDGLFSGPGGALKNNTRKGRPAPAVQSNDTVDPRAFEQNSIRKEQPVENASQRSGPVTSGFDDDAWDVKPSQSGFAPAPAQKPLPTGAMSELSLLSPPLQPTHAPPPPQQQIALQPTGADPSFFDQLARPSTAQAARARPQPSQQLTNQVTGLAPPPQRPMSAPQNFVNNNPNAFLQSPLRPQMTSMQSQLAPPGSSMNDITQQRSQQQQSMMMQQPQMYPQQTGFAYGQQPTNGIMHQPTGYNPSFQQQQPTGYGQMMMPQPTGFQQQPYLNTQPTGSPFADPSSRPPFASTLLQPQATGYSSASVYNPSMMSMPPMQSQPTGYFPAMQPQPTGFLNNTNGFQSPSQLPMQQQQQQQQVLAPLTPQKTGPAPSVRFGVQAGAPKLMPQPTGRRANLSQASMFFRPFSVSFNHGTCVLTDF